MQRLKAIENRTKYLYVKFGMTGILFDRISH